MSTDLVENRKHGYSLTRFYGGDSRGVCLQITNSGPGVADQGRYVQLTKEAAEELVGDIAETFLEIDPPAAVRAEVRAGVEWAAERAEEIEKLKLELEEEKQHARELFDEAKAARKEAAEAREEARASGIERRKLKEETEALGKELAHAREEKARTERDLSRALGYIDRVVESEPPVTDPIAVVNRHCGEVGESFISGPTRRGPTLSGGFRSDSWR